LYYSIVLGVLPGVVAHRVLKLDKPPDHDGARLFQHTQLYCDEVMVFGRVTGEMPYPAPAMGENLLDVTLFLNRRLSRSPDTGEAIWLTQS
jgi:hypothetical protein